MPLSGISQGVAQVGIVEDTCNTDLAHLGVGMEIEKEAKGIETLVLPAWPKRCADREHLEHGMPFAFFCARSTTALIIPSPCPMPLVKSSAP